MPFAHLVVHIPGLPINHFFKEVWFPELKKWCLESKIWVLVILIYWVPYFKDFSVDRTRKYMIHINVYVCNICISISIYMFKKVSSYWNFQLHPRKRVYFSLPQPLPLLLICNFLSRETWFHISAIFTICVCLRFTFYYDLLQCFCSLSSQYPIKTVSKVT